MDDSVYDGSLGSLGKLIRNVHQDYVWVQLGDDFGIDNLC